ncbi:MAG: glycosyltransferase family 39 protein [Chloroflexi bacterium]|nr:glycosyltransferase family 39 protein [Chloroflexota bacterium]
MKQVQKAGIPFSNVSQQKTSAHIFIALILLVLLASLLRLYNLGERSLWHEGASSVGNVRAILKLPPFEDGSLFDAVVRDRLPPLYFFSLIPFYYISQSEWLMRLPSAIWGIATIPLVYCFGSRLFNKKIGLIGALLLVFSPFHIYYSQQLRPYSLFLLLSVLIFFCSYLALKDNRNIYYIGIIVASVLGMYTHTYTLFPLFIMNLYFIFRWKEHRRLLRKWFLSHLMIVILCIPALYLVVYHIMTGRTGLGGFSPLMAMVGTFYLFTLGRIFLPTQANLVFIVIGGVVFGVGLLVGIWALWREKGAKSGRQRWSFFLAVAITYITIWLISFGITLFDYQRANYLIFLLPFYYLLVAKGWDYLSKPVFKTTLVISWVVISLISIYPFYFEWDQVGKGNFRAAANYVQLNLEENDAIYHLGKYTAVEPFNYYFDWSVPQIRAAGMRDLNYTSDGGIWLVVLQGRSALEVSKELSLQKQISTQDQRDDAASLCTGYVKDESFHLVDLQVFPGKNRLIVCLYRREGSVPLNQKE